MYTMWNKEKVNDVLCDLFKCNVAALDHRGSKTQNVHYCSERVQKQHKDKPILAFSQCSSLVYSLLLNRTPLPVIHSALSTKEPLHYTHTHISVVIFSLFRHNEGPAFLCSIHGSRRYASIHIKDIWWSAFSSNKMKVLRQSGSEKKWQLFWRGASQEPLEGLSFISFLIFVLFSIT